MNTDNRIIPRYSFIERIILVTQTEQQLITDSENISTGGVFLVTDEPLPVGTCGFLKLMVGLSDMKKEIDSKFIVSHTAQSNFGAEGMGIEFIDMPGDHKVLLEELIGQISGI
jgi:c-di-GMP-binding flagellar brake protein YcgR